MGWKQLSYSAGTIQERKEMYTPGVRPYGNAPYAPLATPVRPVRPTTETWPTHNTIEA